jgi:2,5-diketo-D-gluconate reductase A
MNVRTVQGGTASACLGRPSLRARTAPSVTVMSTPNMKLNNGVELPALGFGVYQTPPDETAAAVETALGIGYRHVDTAAAYGNERAVGEALRRSGLDRSDLFVETKVGSPTTGTTRRYTRSTRARASSGSTRSTC